MVQTKVNFLKCGAHSQEAQATSIDYDVRAAIVYQSLRIQEGDKTTHKVCIELINTNQNTIEAWYNKEQKTVQSVTRGYLRYYLTTFLRVYIETDITIQYS